MPEQSNHTCMLLGFPAVGKSTFLAALWHLVSIAEVDTALRFHRLIGDSTYLNQLTEKWLKTEEVDRTPINKIQLAAMELIDPTDAQIITLRFPDLAGESFELQWVDHVVAKEYAELVHESSGALLLLNPELVLEESLISEANDAISPAFEEEPQEGDEDSVEPTQNPLATWDPHLAPTQIKVVEVLQILSQFIPGQPFRVALIISAWDSLEKQRKTPTHWLNTRLPLLVQYLEANPEIFSYKAFGVSAQGGDYRKANDLRGYSKHSERIKVVDGEQPISHDLTLPIRWVLKER